MLKNTGLIQSHQHAKTIVRYGVSSESTATSTRWLIDLTRGCSAIKRSCFGSVISASRIQQTCPDQQRIGRLRVWHPFWVYTTSGVRDRAASFTHKQDRKINASLPVMAALLHSDNYAVHTRDSGHAIVMWYILAGTPLRDCECKERPMLYSIFVTGLALSLILVHIVFTIKLNVALD